MLADQLRLVRGQIRSAWRFRLHAVIAAWTIALLGWVVVVFIPARYESAARVYVDASSLVQPLLEGITVSSNTTGAVDIVRRVLLSRPNLEQVIASTALKNRWRTPIEKEELVKELAQEIKIVGATASPVAREPTLYSITYRDTDPALAFQVVTTLLDSLVQQSIGEDREDASQAQDFLREQIADYQRRLTKSEVEIANVRKRTLDASTGDAGGYFARLQAETNALEELDARRTVALAKREQLRARLGIPQSSPAAGTGASPSELDLQLADAMQRLNDLRSRFTDRHPDVVALQDTVARLQEARRRDGSSTSTTLAPSQSIVSQNLQVALNEVELELAGIDSETAMRKDRVAALRAGIDTIPNAENELAKLQREYGVTRGEYERLLQRFETARMSNDAGPLTQLHFRVLDPPTKALQPVAPKRVQLLLGVFVAALGGGVALAWLLAQLRPTYTDRAQLVALTDCKILATVAEFPTAHQRRWRRLALTAIACSLLALSVLLVVLVASHNQIEAWRGVLQSETSSG
jgi:polysaccharide chain length determinant protein (PEP-CTERM system associated)